MHRSATRKARRYLQHCLLDQHRHRVQVPRQRLQSQPLCLQRDGAAPTERVENWRRPVGEATIDLRPGLAQHSRVVAVLPFHKPFQNLEQPLPLRLLFGRAQGIVSGRIIDQGCPDNRSRCRQRTTSPPQVQGTWMSMAYGLFSSRLLVDRRQWQRYLDQLWFVVAHCAASDRKDPEVIRRMIAPTTCTVSHASSAEAELTV